MADFLSITETRGSLLNAEQFGRMVLRYSLAAEMAAGQRVLEVACGAGIGLGLLIDRAHSITACDYSRRVLANANCAIGTRTRLSAADAQSLPFADASFDLLVSYEAIYYMASPGAFLHECRRVLAGDGRMLLGTSNPDWPYFVPGAFSRHYPSAPELSTLLHAAGFTSCQLYGSLPVRQKSTMRDTTRARLRQIVLRVGLLNRDNVLTRILKRLSYGSLTALPAILPATLAVDAPFEQLTPIAGDRPDRCNRVLFALAS